MPEDDLSLAMREEFKVCAGSLFKHHYTEDYNPIKKIVNAMLDVAATMAIAFGCPSGVFAKKAMDAYERSLNKKTFGFASSVGGLTDVRQKKILN